MEHDCIYGLYCLALTSFGLTDQLLRPKWFRIKFKLSPWGWQIEAETRSWAI